MRWYSLWPLWSDCYCFILEALAIKICFLNNISGIYLLDYLVFGLPWFKNVNIRTLWWNETQF